MNFKVVLANGETLYYSSKGTLEDFSNKLNDLGNDKEIEIQGRKIPINDISYFTEVTSENRISETLATIRKKSHELSFDRGKSTNGSYIVPVYVSVEFDEKTGKVKDIRLDGMKEHLLKHI